MHKTPLTLVRATLEDAETFWEINNHPEVRKVSFSARNIPWDEHLAWFTKTIDSPDRHLFTTQRTGEVMAVARVDKSGEQGEISIAVRPGYHGKGLGSWTVSEVTSQVLKQRRDLHRIRALIKPDNIASQRTFEKAGYKFTSEVQVGDCPALAYFFFRKQTYQ